MAYEFNPFTGTLDKTGGGDGSTPPATSADTEVIFNNAGTLDGSADLTWDDTGKVLGVGGDIDLDDGGTYATTLQVITPTANRTISYPDATGTLALVAGSSGQLIYNSAGVNAGVQGSVIGATGDITLSLNGAASTPPLKLTGTWFTGGTATTTKPHVLIEPTGTTSTAWSTSGTGFGVNAPSGFAGNLLDLQVGGSSIFNITPVSPASFLTGYNVNLNTGTSLSGGFIVVSASGKRIALRVHNSAGPYIEFTNDLVFSANASTESFRFSSGGSLAVSGDVIIGSTSPAGDTRLTRDAAGILAQRNGTNAQTLRVYGTYTDLGNHVRGSLSATSTAVTLAAETAGTGADDIPLNLTAAGTGTVKVNSVAEVAVSSTVAGLPATPAVGMLTRVTDADAPAVGSTVAGGGAAAALVWWNGSNWTVIGV